MIFSQFFHGRGEGPERAISKRESLVKVTRTGKAYTISANAKRYVEASRGKRNSCPRPDPVRPTLKEIGTGIKLRDAMKKRLDNHYGYEALKRLDRNFAMPDVATVIGITAAASLIERGAATFGDVADHLVPEDQATSTGAYLLKRAPKI